jgi:hypothetical protein
MEMRMFVKQITPITSVPVEQIMDIPDEEFKYNFSHVTVQT